MSLRKTWASRNCARQRLKSASWGLVSEIYVFRSEINTINSVGECWKRFENNSSKGLNYLLFWEWTGKLGMRAKASLLSDLLFCILMFGC